MLGIMSNTGENVDVTVSLKDNMAAESSSDSLQGKTAPEDAEQAATLSNLNPDVELKSDSQMNEEDSSAVDTLSNRGTEENVNNSKDGESTSTLDVYGEATDSESDDSESEALSIKRPRARAAMLSDDEDDDEQVGSTASVEPDNATNSGSQKVTINGLLNSDLFTPDSDSEHEGEGQKKQKKRGGRAVILSDDEDEQEEEAETSKEACNPGGSDSEEGSGSDGETSSKRLARPKEDVPSDQEDGDRPMQEERSKGTRVQKPRKLKKEAIQKIHSESQRLVRESSLRLPYHKPKQMSVNDFFSKRPVARPIKPKKSPARAFIAEVKPVPMKEDDIDLPDPFTTKVDVLQSPEDQPNYFTAPISMNAFAAIKDTNNIILKFPQVGDITTDKSGELEDTAQTVDMDSLGESGVDQHQDGKDTLTEGKSLADLPSDKSSPKLGGLLQSPEGELVQEEQTDLSQTMATSSAVKRQSAAMRLLQANMDKFRNFTPKLSGEDERVIQLDAEAEDTPAKMPAGVENLMKRFVKHSDKKRHRPKKTEEVQLSIVKKETSEDGKESLKQENITVILQPAEQGVDPMLKVPGAKLTQLKNSLQQRMKERRELERKKRQEAYNIDNEDMDGQEEEEEAEMSSDDEDGDCKTKKSRDSDEDDDDYVPEEDIKEKHEFADDEADEDSDEEYDNDEDDEEAKTDLQGGAVSDSGKGEKKSLEDGHESGDEVSFSRKSKTGTKRRILSDDEDDDDDDGDTGTMLQNSSRAEPKAATPCKGIRELHNETSNISSISSKTSSVRKSDTSSVTHYFNDHGKTMDLFDSTSSLTDIKCNDLLTDEKQTSFNLKDHFGTVTSKTPEPDTASLESSFEMFPSSIPPYQPRRESADAEDTKDSFRPFSKAKSELEQDSLQKSTGSKFPDLSMPVEDSQDFFRADTPSLQIPDSQLETETQNFKFSFEEDDTQSQFLDGNGFLRLKSSSGNKRPPPSKIFDSDNATQGNMDELLGLCSGQFNSTSETEVNSSQTSFRKGLFSQGQSQGDNMNELLGLCTGNFSSKPEADDSSKRDSDNDSVSSFGLVLDRERLQEELVNKPESSDDDDDEPIILTRKKKRKVGPESNNGDENELLLAYNSNDEDVTVNKEAFKGVTYGKFAKKKFFEAEAELSGSECDSDENYDAEEEPDELELDREVEEQFKDTEKLREEVNEVYMKDIEDDDARRLRLFKEMYLREGDLHSDKTRVRKFRWKNLEGKEMDLGDGNENDSEDEEADQDELETQWRLKRHEREQWLKKQEADKKAKPLSVEEPEVDGENSQFAKFMKRVPRTTSKGSCASQEATSNTAAQPAEPKEKKLFNSPKPPRMLKHGSFLKRKRQDLEKLSSVVKPLNNPAGPKSTRGFIFQSVSNSELERTSQPSTVKRSISMADASSPAAPQRKYPKLERSISQNSSQSIFDHF